MNYQIENFMHAACRSSGRVGLFERFCGTQLLTRISLILISIFFSTPLFAQHVNLNQTLNARATVVVGADNPLVDVPAVQQAVNLGGTVILRGTFDFGIHGGNHIIIPGRAGLAQDQKGTSTVFIYQKDVVINGETGPSGELLTRVKNGMPSFWIGWDGEVSRSPYPGTNNVDYGTENFPVDALGRVNYRDTGPEPGYAGPQTRYARAYPVVSVTIKSIHFVSPKHNAIKATAGRDVFVIGNVFSNIEFGGLVHLNNFAAATHIGAGFSGIGSLYAPFISPALTGKVVAERNVLDDVGTAAIYTHGGESVGLAAIATNATVVFERNEIRNIGRKANGTASEALSTAIVVSENYAAAPAIAHNTIYNSKDYGIWDLAIFAPSPGPTVEHNTVTDCAVGILTYSIPGPRPGLLIHQNTISQDGEYVGGQSAIVAFQLSSSMIRANTFDGDFAAPLVVLTSTTDCTLLENRDLRLTIPAWSPTYFLDGSSSGNLIRAHSGTALDLGTNNTIYFPRGRGLP